MFKRIKEVVNEFWEIGRTSDQLNRWVRTSHCEGVLDEVQEQALKEQIEKDTLFAYLNFAPVAIARYLPFAASIALNVAIPDLHPVSRGTLLTVGNFSGYFFVFASLGLISKLGKSNFYESKRFLAEVWNRHE